MFKVGDEMAEYRFKAYKRQRQLVETVTTLVVLVVALAVIAHWIRAG